jgi:hypothetical protein
MVWKRRRRSVNLKQWEKGKGQEAKDEEVEDGNKYVLYTPVALGCACRIVYYMGPKDCSYILKKKKAFSDCITDYCILNSARPLLLRAILPPSSLYSSLLVFFSLLSYDYHIYLLNFLSFVFSPFMSLLHFHSFFSFSLFLFLSFLFTYRIIYFSSFFISFLLFL